MEASSGVSKSGSAMEASSGATTCQHLQLLGFVGAGTYKKSQHLHLAEACVIGRPKTCLNKEREARRHIRVVDACNSNSEIVLELLLQKHSR